MVLIGPYLFQQLDMVFTVCPGQRLPALRLVELLLYRACGAKLHKIRLRSITSILALRPTAGVAVGYFSEEL